MITPLDIENKKFSKRALNGYSTEEVDDFLDELTIDYEKMYKEASENKQTIENLNTEIAKYKQMETTLQNTLLMAQTTADEIKNAATQQAEATKNAAQQQADMILSEAQTAAKEDLVRIDTELKQKQNELEELQKQFDIYKTKMESLLISQLELLKDPTKSQESKKDIVEY